MDIAQHGDPLNPSSWPFLDPRTGLQAIQAQSSRHAGTTNYIGHHMDFQQNATIAQQQLQILSPNGTEQIPGTVMQITPANLGTENVSAHLVELHAGPQSNQAPPETTEVGSDEDFIEADYLNDDSASERDASEDEGHDETQPVEIELSNVEEPHPGADSPVLLVHDDCEMTSSEPEDRNAPVNAIVLDDCTSPNPASLDTPSSSTGDQRTSDGAVVTAQTVHATEPKSSLDGLDIVNDKSKVSDLIKALEDKGALAEFLQELGYQKLREVDIRAIVTPSVRGVASENGQVTCNVPECGKVFPRPCELK